MVTVIYLEIIEIIGAFTTEITESTEIIIYSVTRRL